MNLSFSIRKAGWSFLFAIYLFLYTFDVDLFPVEMHTILFAVGLAIILLNVFMNTKLILPVGLMHVCRSFLPYCFYISFMSVFHIIFDYGNRGIYINQVTGMFSIFIQILVCCYVIYFFIEKLEVTFNGYLKYLMVVGIVQTICVVLAFLVPAIRNAFNQLTINNSPSAHLVSYVLNNGQRCFGLADNLFDSFGYITSVLITIVLIRAVADDKRYFILFFSMLIMPLLNTRTGIVLVLIAAILTIIYYYKEVLFRDFFKYIAITVIALIVIRALISVIPQDTMSWIQKGLDSILVFLYSGDSTGSVAVLNSMWVFPKDFFSILFGAGASIESLSLGSSDIGYVRLIWSSGIIGMMILLISYFRFFLKGMKSVGKKKDKCLFLCLIAIFYLYLYKLYSIGNMGGNMLLFSITFIALLNRREEIQINEKGC